jgi:hypothetical protein
MARNLTTVERIDAFITQAQALSGLGRTHCTLGAVAAMAGLADCRLPTLARGGMILRHLNPMLSSVRSIKYARCIAAAHDQGRAAESWKGLREALCYGLRARDSERTPAPTPARGARVLSLVG